jgi:hypothetical protein
MPTNTPIATAILLPLCSGPGPPRFALVVNPAPDVRSCDKLPNQTS